ncbi:MAG TPA: hypothetical protein VFC38_04790 [Stellaceae bacterium]|nr:hypothetical protein [Stellaceae bacterium]
MTKLGLSPLLLALFLLVAPPAWAAGGTLDIVDKFMSGNTELDVATYTVDQSKVGLIGIVTDKRLSVAFDRDSLGTFTQLWKKAVAAQSATWRVIGSHKDGDTDTATLITVAAGPGVEFTLLEGTKGTNAFVLGRNDFDAFSAALEKMRQYFAH